MLILTFPSLKTIFLLHSPAVRGDFNFCPNLSFTWTTTRTVSFTRDDTSTENHCGFSKIDLSLPRRFQHSPPGEEPAEKALPPAFKCVQLNFNPHSPIGFDFISQFHKRGYRRVEPEIIYFNFDLRERLIHFTINVLLCFAQRGEII